MSKRAERRHRTEKKAQARRAQWTAVIGDFDGTYGKGRSLSHFDCGKSQCLCCHWEKVTNQPRRQDVLADEMTR
jgi:hypothetical protein